METEIGFDRALEIAFEHRENGIAKFTRHL